MMLHEAVMLEIYRQALNASELASPRCQSRDSIASAAAGDGRCPSNESHCSGNDSTTPNATPTATSPPVGLALPATLAPAAAAALLPPQSAAMAAYFNAAAAAAQQNHLLLTNPLAAAASLVQQATQSHSPNSHALSSPPASDMPEDASALDFSTKRMRRVSANGASDEDESNDAHNNNDADSGCADILAEDANSPLDLSLNAGRKRQSCDEELPPATHKLSRINSDFKPLPTDTWSPALNPYLAAVAAASLSPNNALKLDWNGKQKIVPNEATKALEKMTEMTRLGSSSADKEMTSSAMRQAAANNSAANGRHSAWQSHWLNKGADAVKDVFKCVWCKQSFATLATLTTHMKETQHCGVNVPPAVSAATAAACMPAANSNGNQTAASGQHARHHANVQASAAANAAAATSNKSDLNLLIKETMPLPRKLVRGQDVWLGKGAEQTRQILKCMWCGQSFRSLAEMTSHMQETQHYTNIISQEQIISWKSSDDKSSSGGSSNGTLTSPAVTSPSAVGAAAQSSSSSSSAASGVCTSNATTVSAVLTCKVCDQAFSTLKELSNHMVKNSHYKEHMLRTAGDSGAAAPRRGRQTREKRKKSLPVRKLLELERAQQDFKGNSGLEPALKPLRDFTASTKITCEKCGDKIETAVFVEHIRQCLGGHIPMSPRNHNNNNLKPPYAMPQYGERLASPQTQTSNRDEGKTAEPSSSSPSAGARSHILYAPTKDAEKSSSAPSVLNAIEQLIEKSFDTRPRPGSLSGSAGAQMTTPLGSSILKRLGIDDTVDYTKPLMDAQTMHLLRSYAGYSARDRSASESSSVSERCSSRLESLTPERSSRQTTPRLTPEKTLPSNEAAAAWRKEFHHDASFKVKSEPGEPKEQPQKISVKKEFSMSNVDAHELPLKSGNERHSQTPCASANSPSISERSATPKSNCSSAEQKSKRQKQKSAAAGSSLNALSSMFDSLNSMSAPTTHTGNSLAASSSEAHNNSNVPQQQSNANPLAALQQLCDTTDTPATNTRSNNSSTTNAANHSSSSGNMVTFSWACNDAVLTAADSSIIKCSYCDTPFCSKGAYRHHLSKVHFVKDDADSQCSSSAAMKSPPSLAASPKSMASPKSASKSPAAYRQAASPCAPPLAATAPTINPYDESAQSKFLKYSELAKQLSSKNV